MSIQRRLAVINLDETGEFAVLQGITEFAVTCDRCGVRCSWAFNSQDAIEDATGTGWYIAGNDHEGDLCEDCLRKVYAQEM